MNQFAKLKYVSAVTMLFLACAAAAPSSSVLQQVLKNPGAFDGKRVIVTGLADIGGTEFWLYPDARAARRGGDAVFVDRDLKGPLYEELDRHFVKVTGKIKANGTGPLGARVCQLSLERIEPLPIPPVPDTRVYGCF